MSDVGLVRLRVVHRLLRPRDYQHRPELTCVEDWWRQRHGGVCSLEGMGGAGKTATVDQFLRRLPGVLAPGPATPPAEPPLPAPDAVFVFSFYDDPDADAFFRALAAWLMPAQALPDGRPPYDEISYQLASLSSALIVLDGLEKVQDEGLHGSLFGALNHAQLRELLRRAADGYLPNVGLLITTRFPLEDLRDPGVDWSGADGLRATATHHVAVDVGRLDEDACVRLLRRLGVRGDDEALQRIARDCGRHALSVDLTGGYIVRFMNGDAQAALALPPLDRLDLPASDSVDVRAQHVQAQAERFARLARRYHDALAAQDPATLLLLLRCAQFPQGVSAELLQGAYCDARSDPAPHALLEGMDLAAVGMRLRQLVELHLLEAQGIDRRGHHSYTMHPAVRDGFARTLTERELREGHAAARAQLLRLLDLRPGGERPSDPARLDELEALIHHTSGAGDRRGALSLYLNTLGGSTHLMAALGDCERGERLARALGLHRERVVYLAGLGRVREALALADDEIVRAELLVKTGRLAQAERILGRLPHLPHWHPGRARANETALYAHVLCLRGRVDESLDLFAMALGARGLTASIRRERPAELSLAPLLHCRLLARIGPDDELARDVQHVRADIARQLWHQQHMHDAACTLLLAQAARRAGRLDEAAQGVGQAHEWAVRHHARELTAEAWLERARIANARASASTAARHHHAGDALSAGDEGLRVAIESGYGLLAIDLRLEQAEARVLRGEAAAADALVELALHGAGGGEDLLPATDPDCGYAWAQARGLHLKAEAARLRLGQRLGVARIAPDQLQGLQGDVAALRIAAQAALEQAVALRRGLRDPALADSEAALRDLSLGRLLRDEPPAATADLATARAAPAAGVFVSYAHRDNDDPHPSRRWLDRLLEHVAPWVWQHELLVWSDRDLRPGEAWHERIEENLQRARAAVLLISPSFLASEYIRRHELPLLLQQRSAGLVLIPLVVRPCGWRDVRCRYPDPERGPHELVLGALQAPHDAADALSAMSDAAQDQVLLDVARRLREASRSCDHRVP